MEASNPVGSYIKHFDLEEGLKGKRVVVFFEGVEQAMYVWLNGSFVGYAEDSFTPSEFDLTTFIIETVDLNGYRKPILAKIIPSFAIIGLFHECINKNSKALVYLSGACFTIYIVHMIIVTSVGFWIIQYGINPILKYFIILIISYILSFGAYEIVKRNRLLGLLFGAK